ncbi:hypothetical protein ANCDUO_10193 [Ancylostoma duodenale]|uniref:Uncharacterized protein n=1 Tax=Ancylostoma duodenale TaxID=51022 RepID=A0A0C2DAZ8_9BILA|nr:hypothetical protein ANCDUO_10193 [Ancylostoma duodenale]
MNSGNAVSPSRSCGIRLRDTTTTGGTHLLHSPFITKGRDQVTASGAAFDGAPEAVTVTQSIYDSSLCDVQANDSLLADSRCNVSCSMPFSEFPVSLEARDHLCQVIRHHLGQVIRQFLPRHPREGLLPLRVHELPEEDKLWVQEKAGQRRGFCEDNDVSKRKMTMVFNCEARAVPIAPLITIFRAQPALIELPTRAYDDALVSGLTPEQRQMLLEISIAGNTFYVH